MALLSHARSFPQVIFKCACICRRLAYNKYVSIKGRYKKYMKYTKSEWRKEREEEKAWDFLTCFMVFIVAVFILGHLVAYIF